MPRFRLRLADQPVDLYRPSGHADSLRVEPGQDVDVPGDLVTTRPPAKPGEKVAVLPDDAYVVKLGDVESLWPHALWELVQDKPAKTAAKEN